MLASEDIFAKRWVEQRHAIGYVGYQAKGRSVSITKLRQRCSLNVATRIDVFDIKVIHIEVVSDVNAIAASD